MLRIALSLILSGTVAVGVAVGQTTGSPTPQAAPVAAQASTPRVDPAQWAPAEAVLFFGVTDVTAAWEDFKKTSGYALLSDPAARGLTDIDVFTGAIADFRKRVATLLDVPEEQLSNPFAGPLALYALPARGESKEELTPGLVAGVGDRATMQKYYDAIAKKLEAAMKREAVKDGDHTIDIFTADPTKQKPARPAGAAGEEDALGEEPDTDEPELEIGGGAVKFDLLDAESLPDKLAMCLTADRVVVGKSVDDARAMLRQERNERSLADSDDYQALLKHFAPAGPVRLLINVPRLIELGRAQATDQDEYRKQVAMFGGDSLGSLIAHARMGGGDFDLQANALLLTRGQRKGLLKLLSFDNKPTAPPAEIPADAAIFAQAALSMPDLLDRIEAMLRETDPAEADELRSSMEMQLPTGETVNFRKDFVDHLTGPLTVWFGVTRPITLASLRALISIGQKDASAVARFLGGPATQGMLQPREGAQVQTFDVPPIPPFIPQGLAIAVPSDRLMVGNVPAIEAGLEGKAAAPLAESAAWQRVAKLAPKEAWLTIFVDNQKMTETMAELTSKKQELMSSGPPTDASAMVLLMLMESVGESLSDSAKVAQLVKYANQAVYTLHTRPEGLQFTLVQVRPQK